VWWVRDADVLRTVCRDVRAHHAPVVLSADVAGIHRVVLPVVEPAGILGGICCGHVEPYSGLLLRSLTTLATHVSVRLVVLGNRSGNDHVLGLLTPRQADVALLAARGRTNAAIAAELGLSENTVKKHLKDIFETLAVTNRTELSVRLGPDVGRQVLRLCSGER
jgi:DNA-binding CsgD family transcriptional regulator